MKKIWRVFISSTFEDFRLERAVLQKFIFPEIKKEANKKGISFLPIDLRWGVPEESQIDQRTMDICLSEVERATTEPHPDFLILSGDKYGWVPLPRVIEKKEFEDIVAKLKELKNKNSNINTNILETWYELDYNQLPTSYILKSRDEVTDKDYTNWDTWKVVEDEIRGLLQSVVSELNFDEKTKEKYFISATHQELRTFLKHENSDKELKNHLIGFIRKFNDLPEKLFDKQDDNIEKLRKEIVPNTLKNNLKILDVTAKFYEKAFEENEKCNKQLKECQKKYCNNRKDKVFESCMKKHFNDYYEKCFIENIFEDINSLEEIKDKLEDKNFAKYLIEFGNFVKKRLLESLENIEVEKFTEKDYQEDYKNYLLSRPFVGREEEIKNILDEIEKNNKVLIYGESGIGKSAIMAQVIKRLEEKNKDVVYRFVGISKESNGSIFDILISILKEKKIDLNDWKNFNQLIKRYESLKNEVEIKIQQKIEMDEIKDKLINEFLLSETVFEKDDFINKSISFFLRNKLNALKEETIIVIDAIDQTTNKIYQYEWLNVSNVKIILSALYDDKYPNDSKYTIDLLKNKSFKFIEIKRFDEKNREIMKKLIFKLLNEHNRTITSDQLKEVLSKKDSNKVFYLVLASSILKFYKHNQLVDLPQTQFEITNLFIKSLYKNYYVNKLIVEKFLIYLTLLEKNIDEEMLYEILSNDKEVMSDVKNDYHRNLTNSLPTAIYSRLLYELKNFIVLDKNGNLRFFHREFYSVSLKLNNMKNYEELIEILKLFKHQKKYILLYVYLLIKNNPYEHIDFEYFKSLKDEDIKAIFDYLQKNTKISFEKNEIDQAKKYYDLYNKLAKYFYDLDKKKWQYEYYKFLYYFASFYDDIGDFMESEKLFFKLVSNLEKDNNEKLKSLYIDTLNKIGTRYLNRGQKRESIAVFEYLVKFIKDVNLTQDTSIKYLNALYKLSLAYLYFNEKQETERIFRENLKFVKKWYEKEPKKFYEYYFDVLNSLLILKKDTIDKNIDELEQLLIEMNNLLQNFNEIVRRKYEIVVIYNLAVIYLKKGKENLAKQNFQKVINMIESQKICDVFHQIYNNSRTFINKV